MSIQQFLSFGRSLVSRQVRRAEARAQKKIASNPAKPVFEPLEERRLMSATLLDGGIFNITGQDSDT